MVFTGFCSLQMAAMGTQIGLRITVTLFLILCLPYLFIANEIYRPDDVYSISCGSSKNLTVDGRNWTADINTKLLSPDTQNNHSVAANALIPTTIQGPYTSARVSYSQFTYSFPVTTSGHKFIRLFFYPTSYQNFDPTKAYFSVKSGEYTLLKDFNASLYADADYNPSDTFFLEYSVYVQDGHNTLNITFFPSTAKNHMDSHYAFINGIEVVSMPPYLYHTKPDDYIGLQLVGYDDGIPFRLENNSALETKYRFNVGGRMLPASGDTGMLRYWDVDDNYLASQSGLAADYGGTTKLKFTMIPEYTAPAELYRALRHMGENATINLSFNLTWELPVDSGFNYMLRLYFCELDPNIQHAGDRRFFIYVQDQMAESDADVLLWTSGRRATPIVKDYAVMVPSGGQKYTKISLKMSPQPNSPYVDAVLDGLELFKINDSLGNLAGSNPEPHPNTPSTPQVPLQKKSSSKTLVIVVAILGVVFFFIVSIFNPRGRRLKEEGSRKKTEGSSSLPSHLCRYFTIAEIRAATQNFDDAFIIGVGGFGNVYKGCIDGSILVAIKLLKPGSQQGLNEFLNEIEMLSQLRHLHLASLIGYCNDGAEMILVYDFMQRGTLREYLYGSDNKPLPWKKRLEILLGAAKGLHYLHIGAKHTIIHGDVKSTNILLDEKWVAKVSDFGLSKVGPTGMSTTHVSTIVKGSLGYLDPEYYKRQRLTLKSDVYSFGVVLLEVLCARPPLVRDVDKHKASVVDWVRRCHDEGRLDQTVDPFLKDSITRDGLKWYGQMALSCLRDDGNQRPSMSDVVGALEFAMQLADTEDDVGFGGTQDEEKTKSEQRPLLPQYTSDEGSDVLFTSSDESGSKNSKVTTVSGSSEQQHMLSAVVFSEIGDPKAR